MHASKLATITADQANQICISSRVNDVNPFHDMTRCRTPMSEKFAADMAEICLATLPTFPPEIQKSCSIQLLEVYHSHSTEDPDWVKTHWEVLQDV
jgi:hypothetical protein